MVCGIVKVENARMNNRTSVEGGAQGSVQSVLEVKLPLPLDDVGKQIAEEGGLFVEESLEIEGALGGDQIGKAQLTRG